LRVFATARRTEQIADLQEVGIETVSLVVDDEQSVKDCYAEVQKSVGDRGLDYLVNNA
jgi:1-acylglycerone phosphate reductase